METLSHLLKYVNERCKLAFAKDSTRFEPTPESGAVVTFL